MEPYRYYGDLVAEIEILEYQIDICINERKDWNMGGRLFHTVRLDQSLERVDKLSERIEWLHERLTQKKKYRKHIEHKLSALESLEYKVAYMRVVERRTLEEIAEELDYSVDWIKKVSAKVTRHLEGTDILNQTI